MNRVYYESIDGKVFDREEIEKAFEICTGKSAYRNEGKYIGFLNGLFGVSLKRAFTPTPRDLFSLGYRTKAIKLYRELNDCTLLEAKAVVDKWELQPSN